MLSLMGKTFMIKQLIRIKNDMKKLEISNRTR